MLTNKDGSDVGEFLYTPFGEMWVEEASTVDISHITRFFTNQQYDKESGLYYYNARFYDPHLGSFITPDPAMDGLNHYAYCNSNPVNYTDPTGLATVVWDSPDNCPGHYGDLQNDGGDTLDPWEAAYGNEGIGTGGPGYGDSGSSSSDSNNNPITNPYYDHPRSEPYVPINTPAQNNATTEQNALLEALSISPNSVVSVQIHDDRLNEIWNGNQYDLYPGVLRNGLCLTADMLWDCVKKQGRDITIGEARSIIDRLNSDKLIYDGRSGFGTMNLHASGPIQNRMWDLLGNTSGRWVHETNNNLLDMIGKNTYGYVNAYGIYHQDHWVSVNDIKYSGYCIQSVRVFDPAAGNYTWRNPSDIVNQGGIKATFYDH